MYFKKLELIGFKSFAEKTTLHFEPGITTIVGPNGCGKSNIFDSVRWVLGEQSIKELRGAHSQDVIFSGSDTKEPLSLAEVTLTFDNSAKFFSLNQEEIAITRRLFRSGESEYLLNKQQVRLKDIIDILLGTGIGAESYSLVQQGKIDLVLSSRPEDRRLVFDEASGITKYKVQKKEALRKLEETEQNLLRINDIITEIKRQINSLERQANKARKYKEVFEELKTKEMNLGILQKNHLAKLKDEVVNQLESLGLKESELLKNIDEQETKIASHQNELKELESSLNLTKNQIFNLENTVSRNNERINFNQERITELDQRKRYLKIQLEQTENRLTQDEEKLSRIKDDFFIIEKSITEKTITLNQKQLQLDQLSLKIKTSLENITQAKTEIMDLVAKVAHFKNTLGDLLSGRQVHLARKKRLEIEKAKINEEKSQVEDSLSCANQELFNLEKSFSDLSQKISQIKEQWESENLTLSNLNSEIQDLENQTLALQSQKEFLEKLKNKYEGMGESLNTLIYLDKLPSEKISGLMVKIKECPDSQDNPSDLEPYRLKLFGEAKPIDLNATQISKKIVELERKIDSLKVARNVKENNLGTLKKEIVNLEVSLRNQEIILIDKKAIQKNISEQFNKISEEKEVVFLELSEVENELFNLGEKIDQQQTQITHLENLQKASEDLIIKEQNSITSCNHLKESRLVEITQIKTEKEALTKQLTSQEATLKIIESAFNQDKNTVSHLKKEIQETQNKQGILETEIKELENKITQDKKEIVCLIAALGEKENQYQNMLLGSQEILETIETEKKELDGLKNKLYELQMQNKDLDFKYLSLKERLLQSYKVDLDLILDIAQETDENVLSSSIQSLKEKLDSYGTVNLVAIEEYDELKKRYDFLNQQQNDLITAKESLHHAILKINRTTKQMFQETFENVRREFRNYFRMLFGGGDAQVFLVDERDPLESGIEIICRPPGKKLQNVLLLSGGEKSLSAIALIFAIFKVKPVPFCVLDEIDAALDEANIDRFNRLLHEFTKNSQFIVITHNKRTIANADIMYGITMQESGISKIVSVKFAQDKPEQKKEKEPDVSGVVEPV